MSDAAVHPASRVLHSYALTAEGRRVARNRRDLHAAIAYATSDQPTRALWSLHDKALLIQTANPIPPDALSGIATLTGSTTLTLDLSLGQRIFLNADVNPVKDSGDRILPADGPVEWLTARLKSTADVVTAEWQHMPTIRLPHPRGGLVTLARAILNATITVQDPEALTARLLAGLGRGKAYGLGLTLATPLRSQA